MRTLKHEELYLHDYATLQDVIERLPRFLEEVYNRRRLHSALGSTCPRTNTRPYMPSLRRRSIPGARPVHFVGGTTLPCAKSVLPVTQESPASSHLTLAK